MSEAVFLELGTHDEPAHDLPGPREYPADVRVGLEVDAGQILGRYPQRRSALLPLLHLVQSVDGQLTAAGVDFCAAQVEMTGAQVYAVATFYSMYRRSETGTYLVGVCTNTLCAVMGGDTILAELCDHLGVDVGETTPDGAITLEHVECNAACDSAPVVMVNWEFFDQQTPGSARDLVDALTAGTSVTPTRGAPLCTFRQTARILAGFRDERPGAVAASGVGEPALQGLRIAEAHGMSAPPADADHTVDLDDSQATGPDAESAAREHERDEPAPAPSADIPPTLDTGGPR
ncbi:NADH-quinone oxidoreductase subunit NuoE [Williamsia sterculiae]|uniref:NADH dehydrogenase subunit E n=1 Tax=Williamsia sterculiae TaxID=1344003 RepID=A0A1N7F7B3_9NOCA|nr:NADH-quinone oxidoreductase subunit NuoE [Williamsia sterculiae]SIR96241.1 NADH dehydrogenase subunit E [Williamsia sterculiae]